jgi:dolichol-phosphate mannosyltransferase
MNSTPGTRHYDPAAWPYVDPLTRHFQSGVTGQCLPADLNDAVRQGTPRLSIVISTRNEELAVGPLLERLAPAFAKLAAELIVVDDSDDATPHVLADSAARSALAVRLLHRTPGARKGGQRSAIITGARSAQGDWVLVMGADLQHSPETAAALAGVAIRHDSDLVVGTRYARGGASDGLGPSSRISAWATRLVKSLFPVRLARVSDPLSGLFAFRRAAIDLSTLRPAGGRILLEILVRYPVLRVAEAAYLPTQRSPGKPTAPLRHGLAFLGHVARLRTARLAGQLRQGPPTRAGRISQAARFFAFGIVGLTGLGVNTAVLWLLYAKLGWNHLVGASLATQASTTWNFLLVDRLIYRKRAHGTRAGRAARFFVMNNALLLTRLPVLQALVMAGMDVLAANAFTLVLLFVGRFLVSDRAIFSSVAPDKSRDPVRVLVDLTDTGRPLDPVGTVSSGHKRSRYLTYRYDIAGVATIGSQILLPELEFFRAQWVADDEVDISVRVGDVGGRTPRTRAAMTEYVQPVVLRYEEHLGRIGANFRVHLGEPISVEVGPLLARSCHVVYTNIIEPLLRFVMVSRDRMLLHSACVEMNGVGVVLSAPTDTGKTGTVLRLLREHGGLFLSDDMTVIDGRGNAFWFPKPLTVSAHTLHAIRADHLTRSEWRKLRLRSRVHSAAGRSIGMTLSRLNVPIMGLNALAQILVPPPKYAVDRLLPCRMTVSTRVRDLFIIERGRPRHADLDHATALDRLIANTDNAYEFPPFRYLAPALTISGQDYRQLREAERNILASFLSHTRVRVLSSDTFSWADDISLLITRHNGTPFAAGEAGTARQPSHSAAWPRWDHVPTVGEDRVIPGEPASATRLGARKDRVRQGGPVPANGSGNHLRPGEPAPLEPPARPPLPFSAHPGELLAGLPNGLQGASASTRQRLSRAVGMGLFAILAFAGVTGTAAYLRLWHIDALGFNSDEAVYAGQGAAIAADRTLRGLFPVFRAHPLSFQMTVSLLYRFGVGDLAPRLLAAAFGLATVAVGYAAGARCYGRRAGLITALLLAAMPYLVVVSRQGLLDGPMAFFAVVSLWLLAKFAAECRGLTLYGAGAALGLAFISKETAIVLVPAVYAFLAVSPGVRARLKDVAIFFGSFAAVALPYPVSLAVAGGSSSGRHFLAWQLFRPPNHAWTFYPTVVPAAIGYPVLICAAGMLMTVCLRRLWSWRESLLVCWIVVPFLFFQLWPVKGFQYLLPMAAPVAILAAGLLADVELGTVLTRGRAWAGRMLRVTATAAIVAWLLAASLSRIDLTDATSFLAGTGGVPGGRPAGTWIASHTPKGAEMLAIGPSMANILEFYGHREVLGLSVSPNPLHRNPAYTPVTNPDLLLRTGQVQYLVWDAYSAARTEVFSHKLMTYVRRYHGTVAHVERVAVRTAQGAASRPVIVIYEVRP